jgi:alpha,alpha-trehalose phosphorylase
MIRHETIRPPEHIYPVDDWRIVETAFYPDFLAQTETLFSLANGYLGMRGNVDESNPYAENGTFLNGFYESWPIVYGEDAYGFAKTGQTIVNVYDSKIIRLYVDDEPFFLPTANLLSYERVLDMKRGTLNREVLWEMPSGKQVQIQSSRLISFEHRHLAAISYRVTLLNAQAPVIISSHLVPNSESESSQAGQVIAAQSSDPRRRGLSDRVLVPEESEFDGNRILIGLKTRRSKMALACGMDHQILTRCKYSTETECIEGRGKVVLSVDAQPGEAIHLYKFITYHTSRSDPPQELIGRGHRTLDRGILLGFEEILRSQREHLDDFWERSDIVAQDDRKGTHVGMMQQALRWNLFQLFQATARAEGGGVAAKGLTGQGYEGHYFWDTEVYVLPFLIYTAPRIAKNLLRFRYGMLDKARDRARELHKNGAVFPWRTINGEEASAYYAAGTAQYHINADIMYALQKYVCATGDKEFLYEFGAEMLVETARLWADLGFYSKRHGWKFCIHGVTGPDEYNTVVNNNTFTNLMAKENLRYAAETVDALRKENREQYENLVFKTKLKDSEVEEWKQAAERMYIPSDETLGIFPQDDTFLEKEPWDFENTPKDQYPLLLHYHPLDIYRHQVIKQADVILALFMLGDGFSEEEKRRNFDYYDPLTTGDSSLSSCIQSIVAAEVGNMEKAILYGRDAILMDLGDVAGNVKDGCHIASMGGTWMVCVYGFAGMRDYKGEITFRPRLAGRLVRLCFSLQVRGQTLAADINRESATYTLREGTGIEIAHHGQKISLEKETPVTVPIPAD